jgi:hypothetical protein
MHTRVLGAFLVVVLAATASWSQVQTFEGVLRITKAGKGRIEQEGDLRGRGSFTLAGLELVPADDSDGFSLADEPIVVKIGSEQFLIPAGVVKVSKNERRVRFRDKTATTGIRAVTFVLGKDGVYRAKLSAVGLDLDVLITNREQLPLCAWFGIRVGNDEMLQGLSFDVPKPAPAKRLTLPGFCTDISNQW